MFFRLLKVYLLVCLAVSNRKDLSIPPDDNTPYLGIDNLVFDFHADVPEHFKWKRIPFFRAVQRERVNGAFLIL